MLDSGFAEGTPLLPESRLAIELDDVALGMCNHFPVAKVLRQPQEGIEQGAADAVPAPGRQNGHAADAGLGIQPSCAYGNPLQVTRQHMTAERIPSVPLEPGGYTLFLNENLSANEVDGGQIPGQLRFGYGIPSLRWHRAGVR